MLEKAAATIVAALVKVVSIIALLVVIGFGISWAGNPENKTQRDQTGNSVVTAGFSVIKSGADWITHKTDGNPRT